MKNQINSLTSLRFFAALAIVIHHMQGVIWIPKGSIGVNLGNGVSFFFCLSGFVIFYSYKDKMSSLTYAQFLFLRFMRLWPAHLIALLLAIYFKESLLHSLHTDYSIGELLSIVFLVHSSALDLRIYFGWNGPSWSIATELVFYALFPILLPLVEKMKWRVLIFAMLFVLAYLFVVQKYIYTSEIKGAAHGLAAINPLPRALEFIAGMITCKIYLSSQISFKNYQATMLEIFSFVLVIVCIWFSPIFLQFMATYINGVFLSYLRASIMWPVFCLFLFVIAHQQGAISKILQYKVLVWLGQVSFAMYLVHQPILLFFRRYIVESNMSVERELILYAFLVLTLSSIIYYFVELPMIEKSKAFIFKKKSLSEVL